MRIAGQDQQDQGQGLAAGGGFHIHERFNAPFPNFFQP